MGESDAGGHPGHARTDDDGIVVRAGVHTDS
jgi:hypothetical protein